MMQLLNLWNLTLFRQSLQGERNWARVIPVTVFSHRRLFVATVENSLAQRHGTLQVSINAPFGSAIISSKERIKVFHPEYLQENNQAEIPSCH